MEHVGNEIVIDSLSSFFKVIEENHLSECIFRGEKEKYDKRDASAFRLGEGKRYNTFRIHEEFKSKVIANLTAQELEHFSAFCQHHGIPTDLLDFTTSPLVALYFACQKSSEADVGYIYSVKKQRIVDVTDLVMSCEKNNLMAIFLDDINSEQYTNFKNKITQYFKENTEVIPHSLLELIDNYKTWNYTLKLNPNPKTDDYSLKALRDIIEQTQTVDRVQFLFPKIYQSITGEEYLKPAWGENCYDGAEVYVLLLRQYFINTIFSNADRGKNNTVIQEFVCNIIFTYAPPKIFKRIEAQQGLFVNQINVSKTVKKEYITRQKIVSDLIIKVQNKSEILKQLDLIGINQATIFNDYDSIAKYVTEKFK